MSGAADFSGRAGAAAYPAPMQTDLPLVVVVEDHDDSRELLEASLLIEGYRAYGSRTAEEALEYLANNQPAAVLTDLTLPGMTGEEFALLLRRDPKLAAVPVIALSGRQLEASVAHAFDDVVMKPTDLRVLSAKLKSAIERAHAMPRRVSAPRTENAEPPEPPEPPTQASPPVWQEPRLSDEQCRLLIAHAPTMIRRTGTDAKCDWFNETWLEFTGRTMAEEAGDGWAAGIHADDLAGCLQIYLEHFERREPFEIEYRIRRHDGVYRYILDRGVPFQGPDGAFGGFVCSGIDIEERRQADRSKNQFLTLMAHELRTPLTPLRVYIHQLQKQASKHEAVDLELVTRITRQVDRVVALAENLSDTARLDAGTALGVEREELDVRALVRRVASEQFEALNRAPASRIRPVLSLEDGASPVKLLADPRRLGQAFRHVLENAVKFSPKGGTITVAISQDVETVHIVTADEGIGVPLAELGRVGTKYFRASNVPTANFSGVGLGLALTKEIMLAHGGQLSVASGARGGTTTSLILPRASGVA